MILVTGATGLVGGHLIWHLLQTNENVVAIKRTTSNLQPLHTIFSFYTQQPEIYLNRIIWRVADVLDKDSITNALQDIDTVYHCAAIVSLGNANNNMIETNVNGSKNIISAAMEAHINRFCFVSSIAACGHVASGSFIDENAVWTDSEQKSAYSRSKFYSEQEVWKSIENGMNAVIVNPGVILGVSGTNSGSSQIFAQVRKGMPVYTMGGSGYVDVRDVVKAMILLTTSNIKGERFILTAENCSNKDILTWMANGFGKMRPMICLNRNALVVIGAIIELVAKLLGFKPPFDRTMARGATNRAYYTSQKFSNQFNYSFIPIKDCINDTCAFLIRK